MHEREGTEQHYHGCRCRKRGEPVAFEAEHGAEVEHRRHDQRAHGGRDEIAQRNIEEGEREHDHVSYLRVDAELAEHPIYGGGERGDVQSADGKDVSETARLHVLVKEVVDAAFVAYDEGAGDDGSVLVHMLVKEAADSKLHGEDEVGLALGKQFRPVRIQREQRIAQDVRCEECVERFVTHRGQFPFKQHDVSRTEVGRVEGDIDDALPFGHAAVYVKVFHVKLRHAVLDDYLARDAGGESASGVRDQTGIDYVRGARA